MPMFVIVQLLGPVSESRVRKHLKERVAMQTAIPYRCYHHGLDCDIPELGPAFAHPLYFLTLPNRPMFGGSSS